jgi:SAM-dependent methyltransferase
LSGLTDNAANARALAELLIGMRAAYSRGENAMEYARSLTGSQINLTMATLIAYDLQAGSYVASVRSHLEENARWCAQLAGILGPLVDGRTSVLEVGCGEATTLAGVLQQLPRAPAHALGFDISWSRCAEAARWLAEQGVSGSLFVGDLFNIPLANDSVDVVYSSHSLEPNGGQEMAGVRELLRVARRAVVLVEPLYELAHADAQERMRQHGYVRGLKACAEALGGNVLECRLLDYARNPLNPSGVVLISKREGHSIAGDGVTAPPGWRCPLTGAPMRGAEGGDVFVVEQAGLAYPVLRGIPLLRAEHAIIASKVTP